jgi:DNA polymerase-3 subunit gamma/tau
MTYQVLARKWRPKIFSEVIGQEHVLTSLIHALDNNRLHHAYLLSGTRGVGKTTLARILAKCLNCEKGVSSKPCEACSSCEQINAGRFVDLIEIDAASKTKVEDTRELLDNVQFAPTVGRYKVYLIDEVHMLSTHSFNALLKTLEEPPEHVKFILATTDPQKLPITVLSRCLQFNLKNLTPDKLTEHLKYICQAENIIFELDALVAIARSAAGSVRDALSLLDQAISFGAGEVKASLTYQMLGLTHDQIIYDLAQDVLNNNASSLFKKLPSLYEKGMDPILFFGRLSRFLYEVAFWESLQGLPGSEFVPGQVKLLAEKID